MTVVFWIGPGKDERKLDAYIGIGDEPDNPATKYFQTKRTYTLSGNLDWRILWLSSDRARIDIYDCSDNKSSRKYPDPLCAQLDSLEVQRETLGGPFHETRTQLRKRWPVTRKFSEHNAYSNVCFRDARPPVTGRCGTIDDRAVLGEVTATSGSTVLRIRCGHCDEPKVDAPGRYGNVKWRGHRRSCLHAGKLTKQLENIDMSYLRRHGTLLIFVGATLCCGSGIAGLSRMRLRLR